MAGKIDPKTMQNGPADPAPAPVSDQEEGHRQTDPTPQILRPRVPGSGPDPAVTDLPSSNQSTPENEIENEIEKNSAPKKRGRKPGCVKTGGRKKPGPEPSGREARKYLEQNSGYLDLLCRMLRGKPIKRQGPTGKVIWYHPDFDDQKWALAQVLPRMIPTLASQELTGDADNPLAFKDAGEPLSMTELARRTVFILDKAAREADDARRGDAVAPGRAGVTARGGSLPPSVPAPAPTIPEPEAAAAPTSTGFDPSIPGTYSDTYGWIDGGPGTLEAGEAKAAAPQPSREPTPGEMAEVAGYEIRCKENSREGLPDIFEIWDDHGRQVRYPVNGFERALKKIREIAGDVDMTVKISKPRPAFSQSRPDERAERSVSAPVVHGSYPHRKR